MNGRDLRYCSPTNRTCYRDVSVRCGELTTEKVVKIISAIKQVNAVYRLVNERNNPQSTRYVFDNNYILPRPPLWSSGQSSWLQIQRSLVRFPALPDFWVVVGPERGPLSLVSIIEELLERTVAAPVYKTEINGRGESLRWPHDTLYPLKLALTSPRNGGRSVGIVRWRTKPRSFFI
jgi:hypothetical protein